MTHRVPARWAGLLLLVLAAGAETSAPAAESLVLRYEGNRLSIRQPASVPYSDIQSMLAALGRGSLAGPYAMVLFRDSPREIVGYVLAVEREGTLAVGSQLHEWDPGGRRYRLLRGELYRSYQPLEGDSPWKWLVAVPVSRERQAFLVVQAPNRRWPIQSVAISVGEAPH